MFVNDSRLTAVDPSFSFLPLIVSFLLVCSFFFSSGYIYIYILRNGASRTVSEIVFFKIYIYLYVYIYIYSEVSPPEKKGIAIQLRTYTRNFRFN